MFLCQYFVIFIHASVDNKDSYHSLQKIELVVTEIDVDPGIDVEGCPHNLIAM